MDSVSDRELFAFKLYHTILDVCSVQNHGSNRSVFREEGNSLISSWTNFLIWALVSESKSKHRVGWFLEYLGFRTNPDT